MILLAAIIAFNCHQQPIIKPKPIYTRQMRLNDSFKALSKMPVSASFLYEIK